MAKEATMGRTPAVSVEVLPAVMFCKHPFPLPKDRIPNEVDLLIDETLRRKGEARVDYLVEQARTNPTAFVGLLELRLPVYTPIDEDWYDAMFEEASRQISEDIANGRHSKSQARRQKTRL